MKWILPIFVLFLCGEAQLFAQIYNTEIAAEMEVETNGEFYEVTGYATNKTDIDQALHYELSAIKTGGDGNRSKDQQSGRFVLASREKSTLSKISINIQEKDRAIFLLLIYDNDDQIVGKDRIEVNGPKDDSAFKKKILDQGIISDDLTRSGEDGVSLLRGIVVEDTKTKPGRDFFNGYSAQYLNKKINGEKVVTIEEVLALGTNTKIQVKVENEVVFQFFVNPRADYIDSMIDYAIQRTQRYFQQLERNRSLVKKY